jgi:hypothetical protein
MTTNGEHDKQRASSIRSSIRRLGSSLFSHDKRARSSIGDGSSNGGSSQLTAIRSSNGDEEEFESENFGRENGRTGEGNRGSLGKTRLLAQTTSIDTILGRSRIQRGQPIGFDFEDFEDFGPIAESPERTTANVTQREKPEGHAMERFDAIDGYTNRVIANGTLREYQEAERERSHTNGAALVNGYLRQQQRGQTQGFDTEGFINGYNEYATADVTQHAHHEADTEQYYKTDDKDANETTSRAGHPYPQRKDSLRANGTASGYHHHQPEDSFQTNGNVPGTDSHHHLRNESFDTDGTASESGYHHQHDKSFHVTYDEAAVERMAREVKQETIAEVELSLFGHWINESEEKYEMAKKYIRELGLDAVSPMRSACYPHY